MAELTGRSYDTGIESSAAVLPDPPAFWSYSTLRDIEACPRHYALARASYPDLWTGLGYPQAPVVTALFGNVVHVGLDLIVKALVAAGCVSLKSQVAVAVLRDLGGYTGIAEKALAAQLGRFDGNPRVDMERRRRLERQLSNLIPDARAQLQTYLARVTLVSGNGRSAPYPRRGSGQVPARPAFGRRRARLAANPELVLASEELRLMGRIDLLIAKPDRADITDYKTGAEDLSHKEQLLTYAVLWSEDRVVNPDRIPVGTLTAFYPTREVVLDPPKPEVLARVREEVVARIESADSELVKSAPVARPGEQCGMCHVRQLCDDYWTTEVADPTTLRDGAWFDIEGTVDDRNGVKSWWVTEVHTRAAVLVRTLSPSVSLPPGRRVRLVGVRRVVDPDEPNSLIVTLGGSSEVFLLAEA